ncbi:uncharacterized protein LOC107021790 [Solanum pennellii]|uniref:Uncharacterized protein LOC107021790 n=1 Tax=Solanum pennellii TaxID=28526 RepID=A0ABM1GZ43_SOLPN|nr:uncharacterized protein LOC107021790 [Solanum pennellii]
MPVNPVGLTNVEVRAYLAKMEQAITMKAQTMTNQVNRQNVQRENPLIHSMADMLKDFTRMNPPIFKGSKTSEDPQEFVDEVNNILVATGAIGLDEDLEEECRAAMLHDSMDLSRFMVHVQQVEESRKRKHNRAGNRSRHAKENFSNKIRTEIRDKTRFKKALSHKGESSYPRVAMIGIPSPESRETMK